MADARTIDAAALRDRVTVALGRHYLIGGELGRGGIAVVYEAEDLVAHKRVALKVLPPELAAREEVRERFVREARTAGKLDHPHIVPVLGVHEVAGMVVIAMGLVRGETLAARIQHEPRPPFAFVARVLEEIADALAYAHAAGVVHRDIKPDNILIESATGRIVVTDFGIARANENWPRLTKTGIAVGTPTFMSPEQALGEREMDGRSDIYSLGVLGFLLLTGRLPFNASSTAEMMAHHVSTLAPAVVSVRAEVPASLAAIVDRCLAKRPEDRWSSALAMRDALRYVQRDGSLSLPQPALSSPGRPSYQPASSYAPVPVTAHMARPGVPSSAAAGEADGEARTFQELLLALRAGKLRRNLRRFKVLSSIALLMWALVFVVKLMGGIIPAALVFTIGLFLFLGGIAGLASLWSVFKLKRLGGSLEKYQLGLYGPEPRIRVGAGKRKGKLASDNTRTPTRDEKLQQLMTRLGANPVAKARTLEGGSQESVARSVADDRIAIDEILEKLPAVDRGALPDIAATAEALLDRLVSLGGTISRIESELPAGAMPDLERRLGHARLEPESAGRERRVALLEHQLASLRELVQRQDSMHRQFDQAALALRTLRLDLVKLQAMGIGAGTYDSEEATSEARAVSDELARLIAAAEESRRL